MNILIQNLKTRSAKFIKQLFNSIGYMLTQTIRSHLGLIQVWWYTNRDFVDYANIPLSDFRASNNRKQLKFPSRFAI